MCDVTQTRYPHSRPLVHTVHRSQFSGTMLGAHVTGLLAATCMPARTYVARCNTYNSQQRQQQRGTVCISRHRVIIAALFPRGFVYRTVRRGEDNGPIKRMEGYLGYVTRHVRSIFSRTASKAVVCLDALRLVRNKCRFGMLVFFSFKKNMNNISLPSKKY